MLLQIGKLDRGLNRPSWDKLFFDSACLGTVIKTGIIAGIISLTVSCTYLRYTFYAILFYMHIICTLFKRITLQLITLSLSAGGKGWLGCRRKWF